MIEGTLEKQMELEAERKEEAIAKFIQVNTKDGQLDTTPHGEALVKLGYDPFKDKLEEYFSLELRTHTLKTRKFIQLMVDDIPVLAYTVLSVVIGKLSSKPISLTSLARAIMHRLSELHFFSRLKEDDPKLHSYLGKEYKDAGAKRKRELIKKHIDSLSYDNITHAKSQDIIKAGTTLIGLLLQSGANVIELRGQQTRGKRARKAVALTEEAVQIMLDLFYKRLDFGLKPSYLPMIVPPKDWGEGVIGGYYTDRIPMFIHKKFIVRKFLRDKTFPSLYPIINKAQKVPWRVNSRIVDVIDDIFRGNLVDYSNPAKLPKLYGGLPTSTLCRAEELITPEEYEDWGKYNRAREALQIELDGENGRRLGLLMALDTAQAVMDYKAIYFPYQFDYRGRLYPHTNFLNPQAPKHIKAMLEFSEGHILTEEGLYWLKIHLANTYGLDKEEFDVRTKWTEAHESVILAVANDPLGFVADWAYCDSPFEFLAACFAYKDYTEGKKVHVPVQLDATCSGIQFYSGLLLDKEGAESVNVIGHTRQDIYQNVADKVNEYLSRGEYPKSITFKDSEGVERTVSTVLEASSLIGEVTRSIVKRNTMTVPYSVSLRGMSDQLWDEMVELERKGKKFWSGDRWVVNKLLTGLNYRAIYEVVRGAKLGQDYFTAVARTIKRPAVWTTPIYGFPVLQPAVKEEETRIQTVFGTLVIYTETPKFAAGKQRQGIAPNIIHSLDAELLRYVIETFDGDIGTVHDCFMVHPNKGGDVRHSYKEGYITLMSLNPMEYIGKQMDTEGTIPVPMVGTLDLDDVWDSEYIIS